MTVITIEREGSRHILAARGHATGSPEVCAAVSCLVYALAGYLKDLEAARGRFYVRIRDCVLERGYACIDAAGLDDVAAAFDMAEIGLRQLQMKYPSCIRVETN